MISCAALAAMMATAAMPAPGNAQIGRLIKKAAKEKATQAVVDKAVRAAGVQSDTAEPAEAAAAASAPARSGPRFSEYLLEMTPAVLDRLEQGLAAEQAVRQDIDRLTGKVLSHEEYRACSDAVLTGPEVQKIYMQAADLIPPDASPEQLQKASEELSRRFERVIGPKCGMDPMKAAELRSQHLDRLNAAAPGASGLTQLQLNLMRERIVPLCAAVDALSIMANEARLATELKSVFWVYSAVEVESLRPRCGRLLAALKPGSITL